MNVSNTVGSASSLLRHPPSTSVSGSLSMSNTQSQSHLHSRIASKRAELENLRQLRDLSADLATQLAALEAKLGTLRDGTQSVALVLANWENVLRAISMAAVKVPRPTGDEQVEGERTTNDGKLGSREKNTAPEQELPVPLVRIPIPQKTEDGG
ncbi:uncharacterized protein A1O9_05627 [Exophiala aquamarina CBS 119918]|uniref:DASH complex subunit DAD2 n=1 Tax=Exophiala aquamarina CBS 119918 TaxID=1182545 RepID=A0A072PC90_9EURO|nr:uncharacterized protein A1O9_05627 [Exophiala aquamarina CBS 119918]KEF57709.1 hypothetical protein A1O9_05627 [Exophiala aquamarina CBS 119918]